MNSHIKRTGLAKIKDLASRAGRWLGLTATKPRHRRVVETDEFDDLLYADMTDKAAKLADMVKALQQDHARVQDLVPDVWAALYQEAPQLRAEDELDPSRVPNRAVIAALQDTAEFTELRAHTVGDTYTSTIATIGLEERLQAILAATKQAQAAAEAAERAQQDACKDADHVQNLLAQAEQAADPDGNVPDDLAASIEDAVAAAQASDQAAKDATAGAAAQLDRSARGLEISARAAAAQAADAVHEEVLLMAAWGFGPGQLEHLDFDSRAALAARFSSERVQAFTDMVGRFSSLQTSVQTREERRQPGDIDLILSGNLDQLAGSELVEFADPRLRPLFLARMVDNRLLTYERHGEEAAGKGPLIVLVDCSLSMNNDHGGVTREQWAKACTLALFDQANAEGRDFVVILFSSKDQLAVFEFPSDRVAAVDQILAVVETFFGGGTDFAAPLDAGADLMETAHAQDSSLQHGDFVLLTDGECEVTDPWLRAWTERKHRLGFQVHGIVIAHHPGTTLSTLTDTLITVADLASPEPVRKLFQTL